MSKQENAYKEFSAVFYKELIELDFIKSSIVEYAYIKHEAEEENKKDHYHYYFKTSTRKRISTLLNQLGEIGLIQPCSNKNSIIRYMIHIDHPEKKQYQIEDIYSNFDISSAFTMEVSDSQFITDIILMCNDRMFEDLNTLMLYCMQNGKSHLVMGKYNLLRTIFINSYTRAEFGKTTHKDKPPF